MIARLLAWLGVTPARGAAIYPRPYGDEMVWHWQCYECRSGSGVAPSYEVALNAAQTHQRTQHGQVSA